MTKRELDCHLELRRQLEMNQEWLNSLAASSLKARNMDGMPRAPGVRNPVGDLAAEIADMERDIAELTAEVQRSEDAVRAYIGGIEDTFTRMIFRLRFLHGMTWTAAAKALGGGNTAAGLRMRVCRYLEAHREPL